MNGWLLESILVFKGRVIVTFLSTVQVFYLYACYLCLCVFAHYKIFNLVFLVIWQKCSLWTSDTTATWKPLLIYVLFLLKYCMFLIRLQQSLHWCFSFSTAAPYRRVSKFFTLIYFLTNIDVSWTSWLLLAVAATSVLLTLCFNPLFPERSGHNTF